MQYQSQKFISGYKRTKLLDIRNGVEIYKGIHAETSVQVFIKKTTIHTNSEHIEEAIQWIEMIKAWEHPNIMHIIDYKIENGNIFIVEDMLPQGNLRLRHALGARLQPDTILAYIKQITSALQYAHNHGVIHQHLNPTNVFLHPSDGRLLVNFDSFLMHMFNPDALSASAIYMSPEQIEGKPLGPVSDQYVLGVMAYEWFWGAVPFKGSPSEIAKQHALEIPSIPDAKKSTSKFTSAFMRALSRDSQKRFPGIGDFTAALERAVMPTPGTPLYTFHGRTSYYPRYQENGHAYCPEDEVHTEPIHSIVWSPDSKEILFSSGGLPLGKGWVKVIKALDGGGNFSESITHSYAIALAWTAQGPFYTKMPNNYTEGTKVYNINKRETVASFSADSKYLTHISCSPKMTYIAHATSGLADPFKGVFEPVQTIHIYDINAEEHYFCSIRGEDLYDEQDEITAVAWSSDEKYIAAAHLDGLIHIWDVKTGTTTFIYRAHTKYISKLAWSPDMTHIASTDGKTICVWDIEKMQKITEFSRHDQAITAIAWSPDGKMIVSASNYNISFDIYKCATILVWKFDAGEILATHKGHNGKVYVLAWSPDGLYIASGSQERETLLCDVSNKSLTSHYRNPSHETDPIEWPPAGKKLHSSSSGLGMIQVWVAPEITG